MPRFEELTALLRGANSLDEFARIVRDGADCVNLRYADLAGRWRHVTLSASRFGSEIFDRGVGIDGSSVAGFTAVESGDMVLLPDPSSVTVDEYGEHVVVSVIASVAEADTRNPFPLDPRLIAAAAERVLRESGHADVSLWSPELEFYVFTSVDYDDGRSGAFYDVESEEAGWVDADPGDRSLGHRILPGGGYQIAPPRDIYFDLRNEVAARMDEAGIPVKYHHHENGAPGQMEIEIHGEPLVQAADHIMLGKYIVVNTAADWDLAATFMPKPLPGEAGSGLHLHVRLLREGEPVLYGADGYASLSEEAFTFIGGILSHGRALAAITNPSTNSYRRLRPGYEAPTNLCFSAGNRSAAIRIPKYGTEPSMKTIEFRPADATANPYLAMAALVAAGLDGMERGIDARQHGFGPFDTNIHELPDGERKNIAPLPASLDEALSALEADGAFLTESGIFPSAFIPSWIDLKKREAELVASRPHPIEYSLYFDC
jgi:glutamine synthetase